MCWDEPARSKNEKHRRLFPAIQIDTAACWQGRLGRPVASHRASFVAASRKSLTGYHRISSGVSANIRAKPQESFPAWFAFEMNAGTFGRDND
jgi:hypothetical protein